MRPYRIGPSSGSRVCACSSRRSTGSRALRRRLPDRRAPSAAARPRAALPARSPLGRREVRNSLELRLDGDRDVRLFRCEGGLLRVLEIRHPPLLSRYIQRSPASSCVKAYSPSARRTVISLAASGRRSTGTRRPPRHPHVERARTSVSGTKLSPRSWVTPPTSAVCEAPGSRVTRASPLRNAFGGQVIGSTARLRRSTSGDVAREHHEIRVALVDPERLAPSVGRASDSRRGRRPSSSRSRSVKQLSSFVRPIGLPPGSRAPCRRPATCPPECPGRPTEHPSRREEQRDRRPSARPA